MKYKCKTYEKSDYCFLSAFYLHNRTLSKKLSWCENLYKYNIYITYSLYHLVTITNVNITRGVIK